MEKYYKIKQCCYVCEYFSIQAIPKLYHITIKTVCELNPNMDTPEEPFKCDKFKPCELLEEL